MLSGQRLTKQAIRPRTTIQRVRTLVIPKVIVALTSYERVIPKTAINCVVTTTTYQAVMARATIDRVITGTTVDDVVLACANERVVAIRSCDGSQDMVIALHLQCCCFNGSRRHLQIPIGGT